MIFVALTMFIVHLGVLVWGWRRIAPDQKMPVSIGVPPSIQGATGKRLGLALRAAVPICLMGGLLLIYVNDLSDVMFLIGMVLSAFFLSFDTRTVRALARKDP